MKYIVLLGRFFYSWIFISAVLHNFSTQSINYAGSAGVPMASFLVPFSGVLVFIGGICILLGYKAKIGAWLIVLFLVPVTLIMHSWWNIADPMMRQVQYVMFQKNMAMLGGALLITYFGAGPCSIDSWLRDRAK